jgi:hypothetical protein
MFGNKLISEVLAKFADERCTVLVLNMLSELVRGTNSTVVAQVAFRRPRTSSASSSPTATRT